VVSAKVSILGFDYQSKKIETINSNQSMRSKAQSSLSTKNDKTQIQRINNNKKSMRGETGMKFRASKFLGHLRVPCSADILCSEP